jgi:hypothetical protein
MVPASPYTSRRPPGPSGAAPLAVELDESTLVGPHHPADALERAEPRDDGVEQRLRVPGGQATAGRRTPPPVRPRLVEHARRGLPEVGDRDLLGLPDEALVEQRTDEGPRRREPVGLGHHRRHARGIGGGAHLLGFGDRHRERLLHQHVLAGGNRPQHQVVVGGRRGGDGDRVEPRVGEELLEVGVQRLDARARTGLTQSLDAPGAQRHHVEPRGAQCREVGVHAHPQPEDADPRTPPAHSRPPPRKRAERSRRHHVPARPRRKSADRRPGSEVVLTARGGAW